MFKQGMQSGAALRRARGREEMQTAIIEVARQIVAGKGATNLTIRGIAQELGYSAAAVYEYFDSKEEILEALYFQGTSGLGAFCDQVIADLPAGIPASEALSALGYGYRRYAHDHQELYRLTFGSLKERPAPPSADVDDSSGGYGTLLRIAQRGIDDGEFVQGIPATAIAIAAWASVHGFVSLELIGHVNHLSPAEPTSTTSAEDLRFRDQMFGVLVNMVIRGFTNHERRTEPDMP